jgi:hypothetical protein
MRCPYCSNENAETTIIDGQKELLCDGCLEEELK